MDDFGNEYDRDMLRTEEQCWRALEFFGLCDAEHNCTFIRENEI